MNGLKHIENGLESIEIFIIGFYGKTATSFSSKRATRTL